ncbi:hypothetical protein L1887_20356 [Cichorium endivia]|nr:hypothetical protein L1887_20356 [Cichorium endivia]
MDDAMESEDDPPPIEGSEVNHPMAQASLDSPLSELSPNVTSLPSHSLVSPSSVMAKSLVPLLVDSSDVVNGQPPLTSPLPATMNPVAPSLNLNMLPVVCSKPPMGELSILGRPPVSSGRFGNL